MKTQLKSLIVFSGLLFVMSGCNLSTKSVHETIATDFNKNGSLRTIEYLNPNDSSLWSVYMDSLGNPMIVKNQDKGGDSKVQVEFWPQTQIKNVQIYLPDGRFKKRYTFNGARLREIDELRLGNDSKFLVNQWRYLSSNETIIENEGLFIEIELNDTIQRLDDQFAIIELKGMRDRNDAICVIYGDTIKSQNGKFKIKLDSEISGIHRLNGHISSFKNIIYQNQEAVQGCMPRICMC